MGIQRIIGLELQEDTAGSLLSAENDMVANE